MNRVFSRAILCGLAGVVAWILTEPLMPANALSDEWSQAESRMVFAVFALIGLTAGTHQGLARGGKRAVGFGALLGLVFGVIGGFLGYQIGGGIATGLFGPLWTTSSAVIPARAIVFSLVGLGLGGGIGLSQFRARIVMAGLFGGLVGGLVSGLLFDPLAMAFAPLIPRATDAAAEIGGPSRAVFWTVLGFSVGLFTALVENATRRAWVRLVVGRNEGREWPIDAVRTLIGRDERAHIPLFGDQNVAPLHASIIRQGSSYLLQDEGSPIGTGYQGVRIGAPVALQPGDSFQIGSHQLQFLMKAGAARRMQEGRAQAVPITVGTPIAPASPAQSIPSEPTVMGTTLVSLVVLDGPLLGQRFPISGPLEIGREAAGIPLAFDSLASRRHVRIEPAPSGVHIQDLGSTNGTFVNGSRIAEGAAGIGAIIKIGSTSFRVE